MKFNNKYYILRHGQALSNKNNVLSCWPEKGRFPLTLKGRKQIRESAEKLKNKNIDLIFTSDVLRTKQSSEIVSKILKIKPKFDKRLREYNFGIFNTKSAEEFGKVFPHNNLEIRFTKKPKKGETYVEIKRRMYDFLKEINNKYKDKNILIISHEGPITLLEAKIKGFSNQETFKKIPEEKKIKTGELRQLLTK